MNTSKFERGSTAKIFGISVILLTFLVSNSGYAQSSQYQKKKPKPSTRTVQPKESAPGDQKAAPQEEAPGDKKVDVSDLEKKYWVPKDTEFQVVQNRTYSKANRFALTGSVGTLIGDYYSSVRTYALTGNYFFSERHGVQLQYMRFDSGDNETVEYFRSRYGAVPDFGRITSFYGASYNWVPIYAKLSLLEQQIIYFDLSISPGLGFTSYDQIYEYQPADKKTAPTFMLDIAQHFFLNQHLAIRLDFKNHLFNEEVKNARNPSEVKKTKLNHTVIIQGGITIHF